jgi:hypothetical protein
MKSTAPYTIVILLLGMIVLSSGQPTNTATPNAETIAIIVKDKGWTIAELNQTAMEYLWKSGSMPKGLKLTTIVHVNVGAKDTMCEFTYHQGFGRELWRVKIGLDGKVQSFVKRIMKEGHREL